MKLHFLFFNFLCGFYEKNTDKGFLFRKNIGSGTILHVSEFTQRISSRATELGLNKGELAKKAGLSAPTLRALLQMGEKGCKEMPRLETLLSLAHALKVHPFWLIEGLFFNINIPAKIEMEVVGDRAGLVAEMGYIDGLLVSPGARIHRKWKVQNTGDTPWIKRRLICWDEEVEVVSKRTGKVLHAAQVLKPDVNEITVDYIGVGETVDLEMWFTAPSHAGTYVSYWMPVEEDGSLCYSEDAALWLVVNVTTLADTIGFKRSSDQ